MATSEGQKRIPIKQGLFKVPTNGEEGHLIGVKCRKCGDHFYPKRAVCANCYSQDMEEVALGTRGKIFTYTIARTGYPGMPLTAPFITGQVELPEKVQVLSLITGIDFDAVKIDTDVELYFWKVRDDEEGNEVMAFAFKPIGT